MAKKYYYKNGISKPKKKSKKTNIIHWGGILLVLSGIGLLSYYAVPVIAWQIITDSIFIKAASPIPKPFILTPEVIYAIEKEHSIKILTDDSTSPDNEWLKAYGFKDHQKPEIAYYSISIPKLGIKNATVSTIDFDVSKHLVQYWGTPIPPNNGNTVIFGHSTLPHFFEKNNYKTIFAKAHNLVIGDSIKVYRGKKIYKYIVIRTHITDPDDLTVLSQDSSGTYLTIITCTPPGTIWKRLIIKARLEEI